MSDSDARTTAEVFNFVSKRERERLAFVAFQYLPDTKRSFMGSFERLMKHGVVTLEDLVVLEPNELEHRFNLSPKFVEALNNELPRLGLHLGMNLGGVPAFRFTA